MRVTGQISELLEFHASSYGLEEKDEIIFTYISFINKSGGDGTMVLLKRVNGEDIAISPSSLFKNGQGLIIEDEISIYYQDILLLQVDGLTHFDLNFKISKSSLS